MTRVAANSACLQTLSLKAWSAAGVNRVVRGGNIITAGQSQLISSVTSNSGHPGRPKFDAWCAHQTNIKSRLYIPQELHEEGRHGRTSEANETEG